MDVNQNELRKAVFVMIDEIDKSPDLHLQIQMMTWDLLENLENNKYNLFYNRYGDE